jgi:hypothetical protein
MTATDLLDSLRAHLAEFDLPDLYSVNVTQSFSGPSVTAQLACHTPPQTGPALLAWADTLAEVTAEAWRVPSGEDVHLSVIGRLPSGVSIRVYAGVVFTEHGIGADLPPDASTTVPLTTLRQQLTLRKMTTR